MVARTLADADGQAHQTPHPAGEMPLDHHRGENLDGTGGTESSKKKRRTADGKAAKGSKANLHPP